MQRILNHPDDIVDEMLKGFIKTHSDIVEETQNPRVIKSKFCLPDKVGIVTGGGSDAETTGKTRKDEERRTWRCCSSGRNLLFTYSGSIFRRLSSSRQGKRSGMPIRKLFRG